MSNRIFPFATNVANNTGHSPHYNLHFNFHSFYPYYTQQNLQIHEKTSRGSFAGQKQNVSVLLSKSAKISFFLEKFHSPHSISHSPNVASGEWVGQRWIKWLKLSYLQKHSMYVLIRTKSFSREKNQLKLYFFGIEEVTT